jgi:hypothetical protein
MADYANIQLLFVKAIRLVVVNAPGNAIAAVDAQVVAASANEPFAGAIHDYLFQLLIVAAFLRDNTFALEGFREYAVDDVRGYIDPELNFYINNATQAAAAMTQNFPEENKNAAGDAILQHMKYTLKMIYVGTRHFIDAPLASNFENVLVRSPNRTPVTTAVDVMRSLYTLALTTPIFLDDAIDLAETVGVLQGIVADQVKGLVRDIVVVFAKTARYINRLDRSDLELVRRIYDIVALDPERAQLILRTGEQNANVNVTIRTLIEFDQAGKDLSWLCAYVQGRDFRFSDAERVMVEMRPVLRQFVSQMVNFSFDRFVVTVPLFQSLEPLKVRGGRPLYAPGELNELFPEYAEQKLNVRHV